MNIVIADGRVGKLTKNGYQDGIMGLMSKNVSVILESNEVNYFIKR